MFNDSQPEYWFKIATHDIDTVSLLLSENGHADIIIYHMHQSIEKILKGLILKQKNKFPFIHDLERLYSILIDCNNDFSGIEEEIIILNSFYQELRYPQNEFVSKNDLNAVNDAYKTILSILKN